MDNIFFIIDKITFIIFGCLAMKFMLIQKENGQCKKFAFITLSILICFLWIIYPFIKMVYFLNA